MAAPAATAVATKVKRTAKRLKEKVTRDTPVCATCKQPMDWRAYAYYGPDATRCKPCADHHKKLMARAQVKYVEPVKRPSRRAQQRAAGVYSRQIVRAKPARTVDPAKPILHHRAKSVPPWLRGPVARVA